MKLKVSAAADQLELREPVSHLAWCKDFVFTDLGRPYDSYAYPHIGAPGGPADAFDFWQYLTIWLQWASRLGKTFFGQCSLMKQADCDPCPMMFASSDEKLAVEVTARTYRMLEKCRPLMGQLRPENRRRQSLIDLDACRCFVAWARSVSTLADKAVRVGHANEIDKWEHQSTSKEADPLKLFTDRFKEFPRHKKILESTPTMRHSSRVEAGRMGSTNCSYWVPCPHCRRYQPLKMDRIEWDKNEAGKSDRDLARQTARYVCCHCEGQIRDEHRGSMMRAGVWVPEGCGVDDSKALEISRQTDRKPFAGWSLAEWITGTPLRDGRDAGYQLSSLYALSLTWGDIAAEWVGCQKNPQNLRNFVNQWLAETWSTTKEEHTWEQIVGRLMDLEIRPGELPAWASMVTIGIDRQRDDRHPWVADAWGPGRRSATIAYGVAESLAEVESVAARMWPHADKGPPVRASMVFIDSGDRPRGVHEACERLNRLGVKAFPCKGSTGALSSDYDVAILGKNSAKPGATIIHVDTIRSQDWIENAIHRAKRDESGGFAIYGAPAGEHEDFVLQIMNDAANEKIDARNNARETWDRTDPSIPNDFRDCKRYSYTGMLLVSRHGPILPRKYHAPPPPPAAPPRVRELRIRGR